MAKGLFAGSQTYSNMLNPVGQGQSSLQFTPQMLGIPQAQYNPERGEWAGGSPAGYTMQAPTGQQLSGFMPDSAYMGQAGQQIMPNALNLMNMYLNLERAGFMQPMNQFRGFNFPVGQQAQAASAPVPTVSSPPQGPQVGNIPQLSPYLQMVNPRVSVATAGLPQQIVNAIPSYLRG